jgi:hypothetical protein
MHNFEELTHRLEAELRRAAILAPFEVGGQPANNCPIYDAWWASGSRLKK